jgi:rhodanese-related sulfurtransferase
MEEEMAAKKSHHKSSGKKGTPQKGGVKPIPQVSQERKPVSRAGAKATGKSSARAAFLKGGKVRAGAGLWGLVGLLVVMVVAAVLYSSGALSPNTTAEGLAPEITVAQAAELYPDGAFFVDVREPIEYQTGHIPDVVNIPLGELQSRLSELPKDQEIVVVCRSGNRSQEGRDILLANGFENVTSMAGGVSDWQSEGYPFDGEVLR